MNRKLTNKLLTSGGISRALGVGLNQVCYVIREKQIESIHRIGITRLFDESAVEVVRSVLIERAKLPKSTLRKKVVLLERQVKDLKEQNSPNRTLARENTRLRKSMGEQGLILSRAVLTLRRLKNFLMDNKNEQQYSEASKNLSEIMEDVDYVIAKAPL